jgi:hypothetical protein
MSEVFMAVNMSFCIATVCVDYRLISKVSERHTASIFRAAVLVRVASQPRRTTPTPGDDAVLCEILV